MSQEFLKNKEEIENWLNNYNIKKYTLIPDEQYGYLVNTDDSVILISSNLDFIPVKFGIVGFHFLVQSNKLTSLEFAPNEILGSFNCSDNKLTSLKGAPFYIGNDFDCSINHLESLEDCPNIINGMFNFSYNNIKNIEHFPYKALFISAQSNPNLYQLQNESDFDTWQKENTKVKQSKLNYETLNDNIDKFNQDKKIHKNKI